LLRVARIVAPAAAVVALALSIAACGGSVSIGGSPEPTGPVTYTDAEYGYSITRDAMFTEGKVKEGGPSTGSAVGEAIFVDENGTQASDSYVDTIMVTVYELARSVKASEVPEIEAEVQDMIDGLLASLQNAEVVKPLSSIEVNGVPGFSVEYTFDDTGKNLTAASAFLFRDKYEYQVTTQAATERWDELQGKFDEAVQSFTLK
jgi:hypothetical protein